VSDIRLKKGGGTERDEKDAQSENEKKGDADYASHPLSADLEGENAERRKGPSFTAKWGSRKEELRSLCQCTEKKPGWTGKTVHRAVDQVLYFIN